MSVGFKEFIIIIDFLSFLNPCSLRYFLVMVHSARPNLVDSSEVEKILLELIGSKRLKCITDKERDKKGRSLLRSVVSAAYGSS